VNGSVEESVGIHDKYQFEVKFTYPLDREKPFTSYHVETYMFVPNNLCVNKYTYSKEDFFNDMQKYIRLKTPVMLLRNILEETDSSPLYTLKKAMEEFVKNPSSPANVEEYKYHLKMFCSIFKSTFRDKVTYIEKLPETEDREHLIKLGLTNAAEIARRFRALKEIIQVPTIDKRHLVFFNLADEYLSLTINKYKYRFVFFLEKSNIPNKALYKKEIVDSVRAEILYRDASKYPSVPQKNSDNEEMVYRESVLKKVMGSALFLRTSMRRDGIYLEQIVFGIAAGIAMAFATAVGFYFQMQLGFTFSLFMILVVAYMFKDRIKELGRIYINNKIRKYIYDRKIRIFNSLNEKIGYCKESFAFVSEKSLPSVITKIRNKDIMAELDDGGLGENVIYSKKLIKIFSDKCQDLLSDFNVVGINDIIRFNVKQFLEKMDNPTKLLFMPEGDDIITIKGKHVYHVNMIIKYGMFGQEDVFKRFRIIVSRSGIKKILEITPTSGNM